MLKRQAVLADLPFSASAVLRLALHELINSRGYDGVLAELSENPWQMRVTPPPPRGPDARSAGRPGWAGQVADFFIQGGAASASVDRSGAAATRRVAGIVEDPSSEVAVRAAFLVTPASNW